MQVRLPASCCMQWPGTESCWLCESEYTEADLSQCQAFDLFRDTIWPFWLCAERDAKGVSASQPTFSCCFSSLIFQSETALCGEHLKKEKCFHGGFKELIQRGNQTSSVTQLFDTLMVPCLIYDFLPYIIFMWQLCSFVWTYNLNFWWNTSE